jgi:hypothetical protein
MTTLQQLRKLAELNFCSDCFQKYIALIEPTIKEWVSKPLSDWREAETWITQLTMRAKGAFKRNDEGILSLNEDEFEAYPDLVDAKKYRKVKKWNLKRKLDYLHKQGVLGDCSYKFLDAIRKIRNRTIHEELTEFSDQDLAMFHMANVIASQLFFIDLPTLPEDIISNIKVNVEKTALQLLLKIT